MSQPSSDPQWRQLEALLREALSLSQEQRAELLDAADLTDRRRRELESLILAAETEATLLDRPAVERLSSSGGGPTKDPQSVGPYRLLELLGRGGMGSVYLAERTDGVHSAKVAVKLLEGKWHDTPAVARFHAEREILASLRHPSIARLLDGGATDDGRPFLVMEWVDGIPIDRWCAERGADLETRLRLFVQVCEAVHTAHQNLVVHRDLKPGNILVTADGEPKLLDFGIAKWLDEASPAHPGPATATGLAPMTPAYAAPEQIAGRSITTATDVYALGVLLYELLCGRRPHEAKADADPFELLKAVREQEPSRPSSRVTDAVMPGGDPRRLARVLRGDLDHIALQALAKNPSDRYPSAEQLKADIERYLKGLPVEAVAAGFFYRMGKFVRRHRLAVATTATATAVVLGSLLALLTQRRVILEERDRAELTTRFLVEQLHDADPFVETAPRTVRALLDRSVERLRSMEAPPSVRADLRAAMGRAYLGLGEFEQARGLLENALERQRQEGDRGAQLETLLLLAELEADSGRPTRGLERAREARGLAPEGGEREAKVLLRMAQSEQRLGRLEAAEVLLREAFDRAETERTRTNIEWVLGMLQHEDGRYDAAVQHLEQALDHHRRIWGEDHPRTARVVTSLGILAGDRGQFKHARQLLGRAEAMLRDHLGMDHPERIAIEIHQARVEQLDGDGEQAEELLRGAADRLRSLGSEGQPHLAGALDQLGHLMQTHGRFDEAEKLLHEALAMRSEMYGELHPEIAESLEHLGLLHVKKGNDERAIQEFERAFEVVGATLGTDHPLRGVYLRHRGNALLRLERYGAALELFEMARDVLEPRLGEPNAQVGSLYNSLGYAHHRLGELDAGRENYRRAIDVLSRAWGEDHARVGLYRNNLARLELDAGRLDDAWQEAEVARELLERALPYSHSHRLRSDVVRARCLIEKGRAAQAEELLIQRLDDLDARGSSRFDHLHPVLEQLVRAIELQGRDARRWSSRLAALQP